MKKMVSVVLGIAALLASGLVAAGDYYGKQKVVYHLNNNDDATLKAAMGNIQNHINAVGKENIEVVLVMHGNGVDLLKKANSDPDMQSKVINLKEQGVKMAVCKNTLTGRKINYKNDLFDTTEQEIVPSGVAELARLQQMGYVYVKP